MTPGLRSNPWWDNNPGLHRHRDLHVGYGPAIDTTKPRAVKRTVEVVENLETSASLTSHAGISLQNGSVLGGVGFSVPPFSCLSRKHKDCQGTDFTHCIEKRMKIDRRMSAPP